jgi:hypothetical protein
MELDLMTGACVFIQDQQEMEGSALDSGPKTRFLTEILCDARIQIPNDC